MTRKVYQGQVGGGAPEGRNHQGGFSRRVESNPLGTFEKPAAVLDLTEVVINGRACWQYLPTREAGQTSC